MKKMLTPKTLNGFPVLHRIEHRNGTWTVYLERGENDYVVATWWPELGATWSWGHYHHDEKDALHDFAITSETHSHAAASRQRKAN